MDHMSEEEFNVLQFIYEHENDEGALRKMNVPHIPETEVKRYVGMLRTRGMIETENLAHEGDARHYKPTRITDLGKKTLGVED